MLVAIAIEHGNFRRFDGDVVLQKVDEWRDGWHWNQNLQHHLFRQDHGVGNRQWEGQGPRQEQWWSLPGWRRPRLKQEQVIEQVQLQEDPPRYRGEDDRRGRVAEVARVEASGGTEDAGGGAEGSESPLGGTGLEGEQSSWPEELDRRLWIELLRYDHEDLEMSAWDQE
eukprot:s1106_g12.t1